MSMLRGLHPFLAKILTLNNTGIRFSGSRVQDWEPAEMSFLTLHEIYGAHMQSNGQNLFNHCLNKPWPHMSGLSNLCTGIDLMFSGFEILISSA